MRISFLKIAIYVFLLVSATAFAQGTLRGVVTDSLTKETLPGANVFLVGTALGSATDLEGAYRIDRIPEGTYTLRVSYIGYQTKTIRVDIQNNKPALINVALAPDAIELGTVVVTGQAVGQAAAINQQITSNTIINVVSEEKIQELPDANAAESIGRLPGVSLRRSGGEANKVVLRGLSDKYSTITIDGVRIAPTDADARGVDLSMISQESLAGIELYKALTPDKDADAIAGSVNLVTKKAPAERLLRLDARGSFNRLNDTYNQYEFALRYGERFFNDALGIQIGGNLEQRDRSKENVNLDYDFLNISITLGNRPKPMIAMAEWYRSPTGGNKRKNTPGCGCWNRATDDFDRRPWQYYADTLDCTYPTNVGAYTGAENGYPAGDLNWYPPLKSRWERGLPVNVKSNPKTVIADYQLEQNYPNPFNPSTNIAFTLPQAGEVKLEIYNALGQKVATLVNAKLPAGKHDVIWEARNAPTGIYFYKLEAAAFNQTRKMVLMR